VTGTDDSLVICLTYAEYLCIHVPIIPLRLQGQHWPWITLPPNNLQSNMAASGVPVFYLKKVDDLFLVVALKTQAANAVLPSK